MRAHDIIIKPILTEKSYRGIANKVYTFKVAKEANKIEIRKAIEEIFDVKVEKVDIAKVNITIEAVFSEAINDKQLVIIEGVDLEWVIILIKVSKSYILR